MPAVSQQQQKLFGLALSVKRGETPRSEASSEVLDIVDSMTEKQIKDFAETEHSGLPKKVEAVLRELVRDAIKSESLDTDDVVNEHKDCGCGCGGTTVGGCNTSLTEADLPNAVIPSNVKVKLNQAIDKIKDSNLTYNQKLQVIGKIIDGLGVDKKELTKISTRIKSTLESIEEGVSPKDMEKIKGAVEAASSFMNIGSELKKLKMRYIFATSPMPVYIVQPTPNNKVAIVNKKYADKPDFVVGDTAVGVMENTIQEGLFQNIMKGVKGGSTPFTLVVINNMKKVIAQKVVNIPQAIPATFTSLKKEYPNAKIHIEDAGGQVVFKESVNEAASRTAMEIGGLTGMNKDYIQKFVDDNNLDIEKVFQYVKKGKLKDRLDFVTALAGKPGNPIQKKMITMFGESVNEGVINELSADTYKNTVKAALQRGDSKGNSIAVQALQSFGKAVAKELAGKSFEVKGSKDNLAKGFYRGNSQKFINQFKMTFTGEGELINSRDVRVFGSDEVHFRMKVDFQVPDNIGGFSTDVKFRGYEKYKFPGSIQFSIKQGRVWTWFNSADTELEFTRVGAREMAKLADTIVAAMDFPTKAKHNTIKQFDPMKPSNESVNEDTKKRFEVDFYKGNGDRQTSHEEIIRGDKFSDVISQATKVAKSKGMNYVEFYYKDAFIGSIDRRNGYEFKKGRNSEKSPLSVNEASIDVDTYRKKQDFVIGRKFAQVASDADVELMARLKRVNSEHEWQLKQNIKSMDHLYKKYKIRSKKGVEESIVNEENEPTNPELWDRAIAAAKRKYDVYPSAYANAFASKWYKDKGGDWKTKKESVTEASAGDFEIGDFVHFKSKNKTGMVKKINGDKVTIMTMKGDFVGDIKDIQVLYQDGVNEAKLSKDQLAVLKYAYKDIKTINPSEPAYDRLVKHLDSLSKDELKQLADAGINFISLLAKNRLMR